MSNRIVDIIIPVYNAVDELIECVNSIIKNTQEVNYRVLIINDCSPDKSVKEYLKNLNHENVVIMENEFNLGFVGTVNKGMKWSTNDVVLLNSDTIVTKNWLKKIVEVAYSDSAIATVTPLTNNGTICSVPNFCEDNTIPVGFTIESFADFIEEIAFNDIIDIPTAVGFCMFIKRKVIKEVGLFDEVTFGRGYGEENDFCCRVIEHGYRNVVTDNTFIYHKGSMSFQGEKLNLINKNLKKLNERYPYYEREVHHFINKNPLKHIHENINLRMDSYKQANIINGNILIVLHNFFDEGYNHPIGGTEFHAKDIVLNMENYNFYVVVTNGNEVVLKHFRDGKLIVKYHFNLKNPIKLFNFHHQEYSVLMGKILDTFKIDLVHIHHLIKHSFDLPRIAKERGIKVIFTLHDYYTMCPKVNLLDENNEYCLDKRSDEKCHHCLKASHGFDTLFINKWKNEIRAMLNFIDLIICPSNFTRELICSEYNEVENRIITIEHGININNKKRININKSEVLKIGFLGGLSPNKGSKLIHDLVKQFKNDNVEWHFIGAIGDQRLNLLNSENIKKHGEYKREELSSILDALQLDLICLLSPWPETYSYTLTEAWNNNIPVLVTPMGALKERVEKVGGGWVAENCTLSSIINKLKEICSAPQEKWESVYKCLEEAKHKNKEQMVLEYKQIYDKKIRDSIINLSHNKLNTNEILTAIKYFHPNNNLSLIDYNNKMLVLENEVKMMQSTIGWKVLNRLRERHNWVLAIGKKVIYLILKYKK